jgi:hypothetical protein
MIAFGVASIRHVSYGKNGTVQPICFIAGLVGFPVGRENISLPAIGNVVVVALLSQQDVFLDSKAGRPIEAPGGNRNMRWRHRLPEQRAPALVAKASSRFGRRAIPPKRSRAQNLQIRDGAGCISPDMRVHALAKLAVAYQHVAQGATH